MASVIVALGLVRPPILGHSLGAAMALVLAGSYRISPGAILVEASPAWWTAWSASTGAVERHTGYGGAHIEAKTMARDALVAAQRANNPSWSDEDVQTWADAKQPVDLSVLSILDPRFPAELDWPTLLRRTLVAPLSTTGDPVGARS